MKWLLLIVFLLPLSSVNAQMDSKKSRVTIFLKIVKKDTTGGDICVQKGDKYVVVFENKFEFDKLKVYSCDSLVFDETIITMNCGIAKRISIVNNNQKYIKIKLNKGAKRKIKLKEDFQYITVNYSFGVLLVSYTNVPPVYY